MQRFAFRNFPGKLVQLGILILLAATVCLAQSVTTGHIYGIVTDASGAPVAGATATLSGPTLLEPWVFTTMANGEYHYEYVPLGTFSVSVKHAGFSQYVQTNVEITPGFTAHIDIGLRPGAETETITVATTGLVDAHSTTQVENTSGTQMTDQTSMTRTSQEVIARTSGVTPSAPDLGGGSNTTASCNAYGMYECNPYFDGIQMMKGNSSAEGTPDLTAISETQTAGCCTEAAHGRPGMLVVYTMKTGGDQWHYRAEINAEDQALEGTNISPAMRASGITTTNKYLQTENILGQAGGFIIKHRLWIFGGAHVNDVDKTVIGFINPATNKPYDMFSRQGQWPYFKSTLMLSKNYRLIGLWAHQDQTFVDYAGSSSEPLLSSWVYRKPVLDWKTEFQGTPTPRLSIDGQYSYQMYYLHQPLMPTDPQYGKPAGVYGNPLQIATYNDLTTPASSFFANGPAMDQDQRYYRNEQMSGQVKYVVGPHEIKAGGNYYHWSTASNYPSCPANICPDGNVVMMFQTVGGVAGQPVQIQTWNMPIVGDLQRENEAGLYVLDTWHVSKHLTLNYGLRMDFNHAFDPAQVKQAGQFNIPSVQSAPGSNIWTGAQVNYPQINAGTWNNPAPRISAIYDLSGKGATVLKASFGRYNWFPGADFGMPFDYNALWTNSFTWTSANTTCTEAQAAKGMLNGGCDYIPGSVNLDPNGGAYRGSTAFSNGVTIKLPDSVVNPNLKEQYTYESQLIAEKVLNGGYRLRAGYTYMFTENAWLQIPTGMPYSAWSNPYTVWDNGQHTAPCLQKAGTTCATTGTPLTVYDIAPQYTAATYNTTEYVNRTSQGDHFSTLEFALGKALTHRFSLMANYTAIRLHQYNSNISGSTTGAAQGNTGPQPIATNPNQLLYPVNTTWYWTARMSAVVRLPFKFELAPNLVMYTGLQAERYLSFTLPNYGTVNLPTEGFGAETEQYRTMLNFRLSRDIRFERIGNFRANIEVLNATNNSAPWGMKSFASGGSFGQISSTANPIVARFGIIWSK